MSARGTEALAKLRHEMERPPFHAILRPQAVEADPDAGIVVIALPYSPELRRSPDDKSYHGGVIAALIDLAGHAAVAVKIGKMAPTIDLRIDYLGVTDGTDLKATAKLIKAGRTIARADVEVTDGRGRTIAIGRGAYSTG
jgi:uncharacterized protein (TIGR00369 family)